MDQQNSQIATTASLSCSKSCARAGLFALGLSFLAFVLIPPLNKLDELKAYADYLNLRFQLTNIIDTLDNDMAFDNCWRNLMSEEDHIKDVMQWDLFELLKVRCDLPPVLWTRH